MTRFPRTAVNHPATGIMTGGVAAADFWATLSIHIDSHGRDRVDAVDIGAAQITLTHSLPLDISDDMAYDMACGLSVLSGNKARVLTSP